MSEFKKFDTDKADMSLFPLKVVEHVSKVLEFGANKYGRDNWKSCTNKNRILSAALRHLRAYQEDDLIDSESGLPHIDHALCNLVFLSYLGGEDGRES